MASTSVFSELIASIADRGLGIIDLGRTRVQATTAEGLGELCDQLLSGRGEASGIALAKEILKGYGSLETKDQKCFFQILARLMRIVPSMRHATTRGAPILLNVVTEDGQEMHKGDEAVIVRYDKARGVYVIAPVELDK